MTTTIFIGFRHRLDPLFVACIAIEGQGSLIVSHAANTPIRLIEVGSSAIWTVRERHSFGSDDVLTHQTFLKIGRANV